MVRESSPHAVGPRGHGPIIMAAVGRQIKRDPPRDAAGLLDEAADPL